MKPYRPNVMACIFRRRDYKVLLFHRRAHKNPGAWQFPQGGIEEGDNPQKAVFKEIYEETGIKKELLNQCGEYPEWLTYDFPEKHQKRLQWKGQKQRIFLFEFLGTDVDINLNIENPAEFEKYKWENIDKIIPQVVDFKQHVYKSILPYFEKIIKKTVLITLSS